METGSNRQLAAILAADVVGYSRLMGEDEARTLGALRQLREETLIPTVAAHSGRIVKSLGDGWLVCFDSATAAVLCGLSMQDRVNSDAPMRLRIGIHLGDVVFEDGDIFGDGVNIAARLEAIAVPGGIALSDTVWSSLDGTIRSRFADLGPQRLKNIATAVRVWTSGAAAEMKGASARQASLPEDRVSLSVAPFSAPGNDEDRRSLAEGIAEDLATELSRFRWLDVVEHQEEVRARYLLGGAVRGSGQRVRVSAHLTYVPTGRRVWSERWDRGTDDLLAVQDDLVATMVTCVSPELDVHEKSLVGARPATTLTARELSLRTNELLSTGQIGVFDEAAATIEQAVALDPRNAEVQVQKAMVAYRKACSGAWPVREHLSFALNAARQAIGLDPRLASGYGMISAIYGVLGETDRALDAAERIADLNPNAWGAPHGRSVALAFAPPDWVVDPASHAQALLDQAELTLHMAPSSAYRAGHLFFRGLGVLMRDEASDLSAAIAALDRSVTEHGTSWWPSLFLALAEVRRDRAERAEARVREAREAFPALSLSAAQALFGGSHVGSRWRAEIERLPDLGLPRD